MLSLPNADGLVAVLLVTERCQLSCNYCEMKSSNEDMPIGLALRAIEDLHRMVPLERSIRFIWHGGEPLMRGVGFFQEVHRHQARLRSYRRIENLVQTNGLLLDESFLSFMEATGDFHPIISMDGPSSVTVPTRGVAAESYIGVFESLRRRGIEFGLSVVGSPELLRHKSEVLRWFSEMALPEVGMTPYQVCGAKQETLPSPHLLADLCLDELGRGTSLGSLILRGMREQQVKGICRLSSFCDGCHRHSICVDPRGDLFTCLRGKWSGLWTWGNLFTGGLESWRGAQDGPPPFRKTLPEACETCAWKARCRGGCPSNAKAMNGGPEHPDFYCGSFKRLFHAQEIQVLEELMTFAEQTSQREKKVDDLWVECSESAHHPTRRSHGHLSQT